jgi:multidrug efflux system outer membrane protein
MAGITEMRPRRSLATSTVAVLSIWTASCAALGSNYERPELAPPPAYRFTAAPDQAQSLADAPWFQIFDDPVLQALVKEALSGGNLDLRIAVARVEEARARAGIARSFLYPEVNATGGYGVRGASTTDDQDEGSTSQAGNLGFRLSWEIDLFGRLRRERDAATAIALATEQARRGVIVTLIGDIASNYFLLRELDLQLLIARETLRLNDETVLYFRNRLEGGVANRLELDRIQANRARTAAAIPDIEQRIALVENLLSFLLGRPPGALPRDALRPDEVLPPAIPPGLPAQLLERRPDVMQAEQLLVAANANVGAARAAFYPTISLTGFLGGVSNDLTQFLGGTGGVWSLGANLFQPIFQGGRLRRNLEAQQARFEGALSEYRRAALNAYREVSDSLVTIQKLAEQRAQWQEGVTALTDAAALARERYDSGLASYIEILTADEELFAQQLLLTQTQGAEMRARASLYRALGGGWQPEPGQP